MIALTRLNGSAMYLNADLISTVESHPDTVITLVDGKHFVVAESGPEVVARITTFRATLLALADQLGHSHPEGGSEGSPAGQLYVLHNEPTGE